MKIQLVSPTGKLLKEYSINFEDLMYRAHSFPSDNPISAAASLLNDKIKSDGIVLNEDDLSSIQKQLGDYAYAGDDSKILKIRVLNKRSNKKFLGGSNNMEQSELFEKVISYPDPLYKEIYDSLIGLEKIKERLIKETVFMSSPTLARKWSKDKHKGKEISALKTLEQRSPFLIFGGDVGTGKTALAESFGNSVAGSVKKSVKLFKLSILTRGSGIVGDMTRLITAAFKLVETEGEKLNGPVILLLDEADTLAQSREAIQMHHEDKAGVNALIQGIDRMRFKKKPVLIIFCTNRLSAIDPAIRRRAADIFEFERPSKDQRRCIFEIYTHDINLSNTEIRELVKITGASKQCPYSFTYSDIINKIIPTAIFSCFPDKPLSFGALKKAALDTQPTRPFDEEQES
ncbi:MAG: AAA family ATPase [bacterium]